MWEEIKCVLVTPKNWNYLPSFLYFNTHGVLLRVRVGARGLLFTRFNILFFLWRGMIGQSNVVYPDKLTPALV